VRAAAECSRTSVWMGSPGQLCVIPTTFFPASSRSAVVSLALRRLGIHVAVGDAAPSVVPVSIDVGPDAGPAPRRDSQVISPQGRGTSLREVACWLGTLGWLWLSAPTWTERPRRAAVPRSCPRSRHR
jgi:hypothetical protein